MILYWKLCILLPVTDFMHFRFLTFLTNFSPECVEWKLNGIPFMTVNLHIAT